MIRDRSVEDVLTEALFSSDLQPTGNQSYDSVRHAVASTLVRDGITACAATVAQEFGDHPEIAVVRMNWAISTIQRMRQS